MNQRLAPLVAIALILGVAFALAVAGAIDWYGAFDSPSLIRVKQAEFVSSNARRAPDDRAEWKSVSLPDEWHKHPDLQEQGWYRINFALDAEPTSLQAVFVRYRRAQQVSFFVNGKRIGGSREESPGARGRISHGLEATLGLGIPPHLLHAGINTIHVNMHASSHQAKSHGLGEVFIGDARTLRRLRILMNEQGANSTSNALAMAMAAGIITLFLWLARKHDRVMLWFGMTCIFWGATGLIYGKLRWEGMEQVASVLYAATAYGLVVPTIILSLRTVDLTKPKFEAALWLFFLCALSYPLWPTQPWPGALLAWEGLNMAFLLGTAAVIARAAPRPMAWPMILQVGALTVMAAFMGSEILRFLGWLPVESPIMRHYHVPVMLLAMGAACFERHARAVRKTDHMNVDLERRVAEKTREIEQHQVQIESAMRERILADERQRILADMHDGLGATLVSLLRHVRSGSANPASIRGKAQEVLQEMRAAIDALQPHGGDLAAVLGALRPRLDGLIGGSGLRLEWHVDALPNVGELSASAVFSLQRIVLEAVGNALKHSGATVIRFSAGTDNDGNIEIRIEDNGTGFDLPQASSGLGIGNMQARADRIGARLEVSAQPGTGTTIHLALPHGLPTAGVERTERSRGPEIVRSALGTLFAAAALLCLPAVPSSEAATPARVIEFEQAEFVSSSSTVPPDNDAPWQRVELPDEWRKRPESGGIGWYRIKFNADKAPRQLQAIVLAHRRAYDMAFFINGRLAGTAADNQSLAGNRITVGLGSPIRHNILASMLHAGENIIHVRMEASTHPALMHGLGRVYFGDARSARRIYNRFSTFGFELKRELIFMLLAAGLIAAFMWLARPRDRVIFWFSVTCLSWGAFSIAYLMWRWSDWTSFSALLVFYHTYGLVVPAVILSLRTVDLKWRGFETALWSFFAIELSYPLWAERWPPMHVAWDAANAGLLLFALATVVGTTRQPMRWPMALQIIALATMAAVISLEIVRYLGWIDVETLQLRHFHVPLMLVAMGALCFDRYARALREAELATTGLERKVAERTRALEANHSHIAEARREHTLARERSRILADMHEGLGANLVSLIAKIDAGKTDMPEIERQVQGALQEMRIAINALQTQSADLATALGGLRERLDGMLSGSGVRLEWDVNELPPARELNPAEVFSLQRIVLEAVANTLEHAAANRLRFVAGTAPDGDIEIRIEDNGRGFDHANARTGPGLMNMRERAKRLGAQLSADTCPRGGTVVRLIIPGTAKSQIAGTPSRDHATEHAVSTVPRPQTA